MPATDTECPRVSIAEHARQHLDITLNPNTDTDGLPGLHPDAAVLPRDGTVTWVGHASFLLRLGGHTLLLDPLLTDRVHDDLPSGQRRVPLPTFLEGLDRLDAILLSHGHNDHVNDETLQLLTTRFPGVPVIAPSGLVPLLAKLDLPGVVSVAQFSTHRLGRLVLTPVPVRHETSPVNPFRLREQTPSAWVIEAGAHRIYFAGDTAYGPHGAEARARLGRFDLALLPIGSYRPREIFCGAHETPEEAARLARDLGAPVAIGHHWGTYTWGIEPPREIRDRFLATACPSFWPRIVDIGEPVQIR